MKYLLEKILIDFKTEIFFGLKFFLAITLLISGFLFGRIYENRNLSNFLGENGDNFSIIEIKKISEEGIEGKLNFGSLKILKDGKRISLDSGEFFIEK